TAPALTGPDRSELVVADGLAAPLCVGLGFTLASDRVDPDDADADVVSVAGAEQETITAIAIATTTRTLRTVDAVSRCKVTPSRRYDEPMATGLRVLVEQPTRGKRWVAVAADWPGLERGGKTEDEAVEKLSRYRPRYLPVAKRVRLGTELATQTDVKIIGRYPGVGSTDFWGISFAPSPLDRKP